ncbi:MAG: hypothetical protein H6R41_723 [Deltaproteobacteria bacterium]|nr:hypothetical protein [Deltaproteobacteria bacterium]
MVYDTPYYSASLRAPFHAEGKSGNKGLRLSP